MTKAQTAANYIFWLRRLQPAVDEDPSKPPHDGEEGGNRAAHIECQDLTFAYESRPNAKVLDDISVDVSLLNVLLSSCTDTYLGLPWPVHRFCRRKRLWKEHHDISPRALLRSHYRAHYM